MGYELSRIISGDTLAQRAWKCLEGGAIDGVHQRSSRVDRPKIELRYYSTISR